MRKFTGRALLIILCSVIAGVLLLGLVFTIPQERIEPKVERAALEIIKEEGTYPHVTEYATSAIDNWTDSIMLLEAAHANEGGVFESAMKVRRFDWGEGIPNESLCHYYEGGTDDGWTEEYPQYWHGYLVFLKPLLAVFEYSQIRVINTVLQAAVTLAVCIVLRRKGMKAYILPYLICYGLLMPAATGKCMQYSACFYIMSLACLAVLFSDRAEDPRAARLYIYLSAGIAAAYFDFLTYPIVTLGMPAVMSLNMAQESRKPSAALRGFLAAAGAWLLGYGLMWLGKFAAGSLICGEDLFASAASHVNRWMGSGPEFTVPYVFYHSIRDFAYTPVMIIAVIFAIAVFIRIIVRRGGLSGQRSFVKDTVISYLIPALLPFVYYIIMLNPSGVHFGLFGHKTLLVCAFAVLCGLVKIRERSTAAQ